MHELFTHHTRRISISISRHFAYTIYTSSKETQQVKMDLADTLFKVAMFVLVQVLVYFILTNSSDVFSKNKMLRSLSFKRPCSNSVRRILAVLSDLPAEPSPSSRGSTSNQEFPIIEENESY